MCTISPHFGRCPWLFGYKLQIKSWPTSITNEGKSWNQRIQISIDVANRLNYHHSSTKPVYERKDVESSKVLVLDDISGAKIANFTLAKTESEGEI